VLNSALGWWWADPIVALGLAVVAVREGREALRGDTCCPPIHLNVHDDQGHDDHAHGGRSDADGCGCAPGCTSACCAGESR
jgi:hypothetical protein